MCRTSIVERTSVTDRMSVMCRTSIVERTSLMDRMSVMCRMSVVPRTSITERTSVMKKLWQHGQWTTKKKKKKKSTNKQTKNPDGACTNSLQCPPGSRLLFHPVVDN